MLRYFRCCCFLVNGSTWIRQLLALGEGKLGLDPSLLLDKLNQQAHRYLLGQLPLPLALDIDLHIEQSNLDQMYVPENDAYAFVSIAFLFASVDSIYVSASIYTTCLPVPDPLQFYRLDSLNQNLYRGELIREKLLIRTN